MKIEKVILQNIGVYRNWNEFDLRAERPIILIGGMNGRGKTTFLEAVLLSFYGKHSGELIKNGQKFEDYLRKLGNISGSSTESFVELHFTVEEQQTDTYAVRRSWDNARKTLKFETSVEKNGVYDKALSDGWDMFVEELLPHAVAPFFFFDGEKIAEMAASDDDEKLRNSILALLGIDLVEKLIQDLQVVEERSQQQIASGQYEQELEQLNGQLKELKSQIEEKQQQYQKQVEDATMLEQQLKNLENEYTVLGGNYAEQREQLKTRKQELLDEQAQVRGELLELAGSGLPLKMVEHLLEDIRQGAKKEAEQQEVEVFAESFPKLYRAYAGEKAMPDEFRNFYETITQQVEKNTRVYGLDADTREHLEDLTAILEEEVKSAGKSLKHKQELDGKLESVENYLAIKVDDEKLQGILEEIRTLSGQKAVLEHENTRLQEETEYLTGRLELAEKNRKQLLGRILEEQETIDENTRITRYAQMQREILQQYKIRLQKMKTGKLAEQMTECFQNLSAKDGLIRKITIEPSNVEFHYYNKYGKEVNKAGLSSGEKQLLVIAMLWALGICSESKFPLIIDTPLARLDSAHRASLIHNYFPKASEQVIILSTDEEITAADYEQLKGYVGKEFSLIYDEETMSSSVKTGYFGRNDTV